MSLLSQDVWHVDGRVSISAIFKSTNLLMHLVRILAIALSRLRMTVKETIVAFESILDAMYAGPRNVVPLATRYSHSDLEAALASMNRKHCKQHERGLCNQDHPFRWGQEDYEDPWDEGNSDDSDDTESLKPLRTRSSMDSKSYAFELRTPEHQLCQT